MSVPDRAPIRVLIAPNYREAEFWCRENHINARSRYVWILTTWQVAMEFRGFRYQDGDELTILRWPERGQDREAIRDILCSQGWPL